MMDIASCNKPLNIALEAAKAAGALMLAERSTPKQIQNKASDVDLVTHVDLACDKLIRESILAAFPTHHLLTEESVQASDFERVDEHPSWIVDPIDGTTNYAHGFPHSAVSIAYAEKGIVQVGVIYDPFKNELFYASKGAGAFLIQNDLPPVPIQTSSTNALNKALIATGFAFRREATPDYDSIIKQFIHVLKATRDVRRAGSAALDMAYIACGRLDGFYEHHLASWDIAAGLLLIQEAGGCVTAPNGTTIVLSAPIQNVLCSNGALHQPMAALLETHAIL